MIKSKKGILGSLGNIFQQIAFVAIFGAIMLLVITSLNTSIPRDSYNVTNESITTANAFVGTGDPNNATFTLAHTYILSVTSIVNSSNYAGVLNVDYNFTGANADAGIIRLYNTTGTWTGTRANITYNYGINAQASNALLNTTSGISNVFGQFPLFGTILGLLLIVGIVFLLVRGRGNKDNLI